MRTNFHQISIVAIIFLSAFNFQLQSQPVNKASGSNQFKEVRMGNQVWMSENLNVDKFRNGDPIPQITSQEEWNQAGKEGRPGWCYYDNDPTNGTKYGKLYNWAAVNDPRGLAPIGWHVPTDEEWRAMKIFIGTKVNGSATVESITAAYSQLKSKEGWDANGNNELGFNAYPAGYRSIVFDQKGVGTKWWTETEMGKYVSYAANFTTKIKFVDVYHFEKANGFSVRCVKD